MTAETRDLTRVILTAALPPTITGIAALVTSLANSRRMRQSNVKADIANEKADIANSKADLIAEKTDAIHETTNSLASLRDELQRQAARGMLHVASIEEDLSGLKLLVSMLLGAHEGVDKCPFSSNAAKVLEHEPGSPALFGRAEAGTEPAAGGVDAAPAGAEGSEGSRPARAGNAVRTGDEPDPPAVGLLRIQNAPDRNP